jgi:hypothetical protein
VPQHVGNLTLDITKSIRTRAPNVVPPDGISNFERHSRCSWVRDKFPSNTISEQQNLQVNISIVAKNTSQFKNPTWKARKSISTRLTSFKETNRSTGGSSFTQYEKTKNNDPTKRERTECQIKPPFQETLSERGRYTCQK